MFSVNYMFSIGKMELFSTSMFGIWLSKKHVRKTCIKAYERSFTPKVINYFSLSCLNKPEAFSSAHQSDGSKRRIFTINHPTVCAVLFRLIHVLFFPSESSRAAGFGTVLMLAVRRLRVANSKYMSVKLFQNPIHHPTSVWTPHGPQAQLYRNRWVSHGVGEGERCAARWLRVKMFSLKTNNIDECF